MTRANPPEFIRVQNCLALAQAMRRWIIEQSHASRVGHIGSALSIVDIMATLWSAVMRDPGTQTTERDRFILAKGHAALVLYCALRWKGLLDEETFKTYCRDASLLGVHPVHKLPGVELSTGSLGQSLSVACGLAYGLRQQKKSSRVYVLMSDGECNEGQVWEAAMFAAHHRLANLCAVIDLNGLQGLGRTHEIINIAAQVPIWRAFGWETVEVDGHRVEALLPALSPPHAGTKPRVVVARTVLGKGVSFMEDKFEWHYRTLTPELAAQALSDLEN